jgi:uncharacterized delta-60 repeat protein
VAGVVFSAAAHAAPGDLDPTFSGDGKQTTDFGFGLSSAAATVRQPDGKIVAVGIDRAAPSGGDFAVARYNPNGSLDESFSGDGRQTTDFFQDSDGASAVALQADGKIVVVGGAIAHRSDFAVARYNPNGSLDGSFSGDGKQNTDFGGSDSSDGANGVAIQANGKIVVVGAAAGNLQDSGHFALARYKSNGSLDPSFSGDGRKTTDFGGGDVKAYGVAIQANGKIVAVGAGGGDFALARYNLHGLLDTSFSGDGRQTTDFGGDDGARGVAIQGNGRIVAVGGGGGGDDFALARYNANGSLDTTFAGQGKQTTEFGAFDRATGVALQENGKLVAVGGSGGDFALARYNAHGLLDTSFSDDGRQTTDFGGGDGACGVAIQRDGKLVAVGVGGATSDFALARYNTNGSLDTGFSGDGRQTTDFGGFDFGGGVALSENGKIVVVGSTIGSGFGGRSDFAIARYNPNGSLDKGFSGDGRQTTDFAGGDAAATGVAIQANGKIVVAGRSGGDFALIRYRTDGSLDSGFSGDGKTTTDFGGGAAASGVAIQANGKIVLVGGSDGDFALIRYRTDGSLDSSFSGDGKQTTDFGAAEAAHGVTVAGDGKIVAVGGSDGDFALARYRTDGSLDPSFSGDGRQTTDFGGDDGAGGVAIQDDGKIVAVGGGRASGIGSDFALARYNPNGSLDPSFSGDGRRMTDFGYFDFAGGVAIQADSRIIAVGYGGLGANFALARYNPNGSLDPSFSGDGKQITDFGGDDGANAVVLQADGRIVAAGSGLGPNQASDFALARYLGG